MGNIKDLLEYPFFFKYSDKSTDYFLKMGSAKHGIMVQPYNNRVSEVFEDQFNAIIKSNIDVNNITKIKESDFKNIFEITTKYLNNLV